MTTPTSSPNHATIVAITGAASGLGRSIALRLASQGHSLVVADRDESGLSSLEAEIAGRVPIASIVGDVTAETFPDELLATAAAEVGLPEALVNNAGIVPYAPFLEQERSAFRRLFAIDVESVYFLSQAFARARVAVGGGGSIINLGTVHALVGVADTSAYAAAKGALHALTRSLAVELAPHDIRVNTLALGPTMTERMRVSLDPKVLEGRLQQIPLHRVATPEEAAHAVQFLIEAGYATGGELVLDGGFTVFGDS